MHFLSAQAGYPKYHICIVPPAGSSSGCFLFLNSKPGYAGDLVLSDGEIPGLPESATGKTVISCSQLVRATKRQLRLFGCAKVGVLPPDAAAKLEEFAATAPTLTANERKIVTEAAAALSARG